MPELIRAVEEQGWLLPTPVQQEAVPLVLGGGDVLAAAETGSGKTGAFALPVLQIAHEAITAAARCTAASTSAALTPAQTAALTVRVWAGQLHSGCRPSVHPTASTTAWSDSPPSRFSS